MLATVRDPQNARPELSCEDLMLRCTREGGRTTVETDKTLSILSAHEMQDCPGNAGPPLHQVTPLGSSNQALCIQYALLTSSNCAKASSTVWDN